MHAATKVQSLRCLLPCIILTLGHPSMEHPHLREAPLIIEYFPPLLLRFRIIFSGASPCSRYTIPRSPGRGRKSVTPFKGCKIASNNSIFCRNTTAPSISKLSVIFARNYKRILSNFQLKMPDGFPIKIKFACENFAPLKWSCSAVLFQSIPWAFLSDVRIIFEFKRGRETYTKWHISRVSH